MGNGSRAALHGDEASAVFPMTRIGPRVTVRWRPDPAVVALLRRGEALIACWRCGRLAAVSEAPQRWWAGQSGRWGPECWRALMAREAGEREMPAEWDDVLDDPRYGVGRNPGGCDRARTDHRYYEIGGYDNEPGNDEWGEAPVDPDADLDCWVAARGPDWRLELLGHYAIGDTQAALVIAAARRDERALDEALERIDWLDAAMRAEIAGLLRPRPYDVARTGGRS
ncbi:MAG: hypothetical protein IT337_15430 [Thermomicrobiales bacterium]|nr:hypothetical protein [Thermomicrobiales bacterium]